MGLGWLRDWEDEQEEREEERQRLWAEQEAAEKAKKLQEATEKEPIIKNTEETYKYYEHTNGQFSLFPEIEKKPKKAKKVKVNIDDEIENS